MAAYTAPRQMNNTAQALLALSLLRSLPSWDRIAKTYGDIDDHLGDLVDDLSSHDWEDLAPNDELLEWIKADQAA